MTNTAEAPKTNDASSALSRGKEKKHFQVIEKTYRNNVDSDYTEKIEALGKSYNYSSNSDYYWGDPELSTLHGTPLYEEASPSQKRALNHLYWIGQYHYTAASEINTILYNQVTSGVFANVGGYETLCKELDFETSQERYHINAFQKIGYKTKLALLGKESLGNPLYKKLNKPSGRSFLDRFNPQKQLKQIASLKASSSWESLQESTLRSLTKMMFRDKADYYSHYLEQKGTQTIPTTAGGLAGNMASPSVLKFLTLNWGSSPFLAAQYYSARMIANMYLKNREYRYYKHFKDLEKNGEFIPAPIAISYYHMLDESFHTTMSQTISQDVYKDFPKPTVYEKLLANVIIYVTQRGVLGGLPGGLPAVFRDDASFMPSYYRSLTSPLFGMSSQEALHWMEKCLCQEHEGFHVNLKYHQILLSDLRRFFDRLDYLWPINREMRIMAAGGSIERAIQRNVAAFKQFASSVA
ncbi:MAG: hypothetical protein KME30_17755 [Iphinoe sp. HA4291-MV1]|jgi:hypothetical protein|nr:hypothetical protein [Iphinoe sp. HA4291-MV1]